MRRERKADDRRSYDLSLTPAGARKWARAQDAARQVQAKVVDRLGASEDASSATSSRRLIDAADVDTQLDLGQGREETAQVRRCHRRTT